MIGAPAAGTEPKNVGWGTGVFTAATSDVAPFIEASEARTVGTSSQVTTTNPNDTYQVVGTITCAGSGKTITEVLLSDSATKPTGTDAVQATSGVIASSSGTTVLVVSGAGFLANEYIQIRTEVMKITSIATNTLTVLRAQNGSAAISTIAAADTVTRGNIPGVTLVTNGNLFVHADHSAFVLNVGDAIQYTVQVKFA